jgi:hypothetical protein
VNASHPLRFEFQTCCLRIAVELFHRSIPMRRYRLMRENLALEARRRMVRRIQQRLRSATGFS